MTVWEPHLTTKKNCNNLSVLSTLSIRPLNSHLKSLKPQSLFSISTFLTRARIWQPVFTTKSQMRTITCCTHASFHPFHVKDSIPYSKFLRFCRLSSDDSDFNCKCDEMSNFFSERGYPNNILFKALNRAQNVSRESALEPSASNNEE